MEIEWESNFKELKDRSRLRFEDIHRLSEVSVHVQQKMMRGENVNLKSLVGICQALDCTLDDLISINEAECKSITINDLQHRVKELEAALMPFSEVWTDPTKSYPIEKYYKIATEVMAARSTNRSTEW